MHYVRDEIGNAAPMHGLGYYNLPQALVPHTMELAKEHLYVSASGGHASFLTVPYEDRNWILVYDREDRMPGIGDVEQPESKDRDIIYALPLNFDQAPVALAVKDNLLFAASPTDGVAVISLADPGKPSVIRMFSKGRIDGLEYLMSPKSLEIIGDQLHVSGMHRFIFDISFQ